MTDDFTRREFLSSSAAGSSSFLAGCASISQNNPSANDSKNQSGRLPLSLLPSKLPSGASRISQQSLFKDGNRYRFGSVDDSLRYTVPKNGLENARYLMFDLIARGNTLPTFELQLKERTSDRSFSLFFGVLNKCGVRVRLPLDATNLTSWLLGREGGWLKPYVDGDRVRLDDVGTIELSIVRKTAEPLVCDLTPVQITAESPAKLASSQYPAGPLLDEFGQSSIREWSTKTQTEQELVDRLRGQIRTAEESAWPEVYTQWGGGSDQKFEATGFFRTQYDGERWWLVTPNGRPFWSAGINQVQPRIVTGYEGLKGALKWFPNDGEFYDIIANTSTVNFLGSNFQRAFGSKTWREKWTDITVGELLDYGFNTIGNWSEWHQANNKTFPYVRQLDLQFPKTPFVYRDFPDVFHPSFESEAASTARQLAKTADDPALVGYFLENEPGWAFSEELPAVGMLYTTKTNATRRALAKFLRDRYGSNQSLSNSWGMDVTFDEVESGSWNRRLSDGAFSDLRQFSTRMVKRFYGTIARKASEVDPNHLNLGVRFHEVPPRWALRGLSSIDVFTLNWYEKTPPSKAVNPVLAELDVPILIGEWHVGALDVGLPASGLVRVRDQRERGEAYRTYLEEAASKPWCVGAHYYSLYDQSSLGRWDGENYNIGFLDVCNRPYRKLAEGARASHERIYDVATGDTPAYSGDVEYLPPLY